MEYSTERITFNGKLGEFMLGEFVLNVDSLYAHLSDLTDQRDPRGVRYALVDALTLIILAKLGGEDEVHGMSEWLKLRAQQLVSWLKLPRATMPHEVTKLMVGPVEANPIPADQPDTMHKVIYCTATPT